MKQSLRFKITFTLTLMVVLIIGITLVINNSFLSDYYVYIKKKSLIDAYDQIVQIYNNSTSTGYLSEDDTDKLERIASKYNVDINVTNINYMVIYPNTDNFGKKQADDFDQMIMFYLLRLKNPMFETEILNHYDNYDIYRRYDHFKDTNYIDLVGFFDNPSDNVIKSEGELQGNTQGNLENDTVKGSSENAVEGQANAFNEDQSDSSSQNTSGSANNDSNVSSNINETDDLNKDPNGQSSDSNNQNKSSPNNATQEKDNTKKYDTAVILRTSFKSIEEGVRVANEFLAYIGLVVLAIGTLAIFVISKKFTKPIQDLSGIAKQMTDLNFDVKYKGTTKDEIGELGKSINSLSDKLETTITELKQANNELQTDIQHKIEIDEMRKEFLSNVSHELKTPISLIQGYAEGLKENINEDEESRDYYCEVIIDEANKMNQMVKKLLSLNELEFGNNQVNFERFDMVSLIRSVLNSTEILFKQKEVTLHFEQTEPVYVWADEYLIEQVVTNYISNALNHVNGQRIIEIKLIPRNDSVRIAVFNTGENIPDEDLDKLWIKFYKVDKARTREYGGSGIGLSIVKAIMNSHNRECGVINRPIGVEFWFELDAKS